MQERFISAMLAKLKHSQQFSLDLAMLGEKVMQPLQDELERRFKSPEGIVWIPLSEALKAISDECIDGRRGEAVVATPGGDAGQVVLLLTALRKQGIILQNQVGWLDQIMSIKNSFYLHTDQHALEFVLKELQKRGKAKNIGAHNYQAIEQIVIRPQDEDTKSALKEILIQPEAVGCGHLKLMLKQPAEYGVDSDDIKALILSFFDGVWSGKTGYDYVVLPGEHDEKAIVIFESEEELEAESLIPAVKPMLNGRSVFVNHPDVIIQNIKAIVSVVSQMDKLLFDEAQALQVMTTHLDVVTGLTATKLAPTTPIFIAYYRSGQFTKLTAA